MLDKSLKKVLVIGSGPIVIGQAAEFDYAGTQACKALRERGVESVLVNSNPATIMTDAEVADRVYIEPLTVPVIERILERERPNAVLGTLGGQTGLNLLLEIAKAGILDKHGVRIIGTGPDAIEMAEDRKLFRDFLDRIGEPAPASEAVGSVDGALGAAARIGYPVVVRPAYMLGGTGGGIANNADQLKHIAEVGITASRVGQILVERSLWGWKEIEYEVLRDGAGNTITVCNMENLDPVGVHTGDSIVVAPSQTLTDREYQMLRDASLRIVDGLGVRGGCNVQLAQRPRSFRGSDDEPEYYVIEVNPRLSRSSALASKATGYPIARVATQIALGLNLNEIRNEVTRKTTAAFEPALDYCVVKIPRWPFDKFGYAERRLGTQMKATGEVMAIGRTFEAALQKAVRGLEDDHGDLAWEKPEWKHAEKLSFNANDERLWYIAAALRRDTNPATIAAETGIDPWFISCLNNIVEMERELARATRPLTRELLLQAKRLGFGDPQIARLTATTPEKIRELRKDYGVTPVYKMVDTCAGEFEAATPYFYATYEQENEAPQLDGDHTLVLGSGPIRIGQGIEFDYSSVHAVKALKRYGFKSVMLNSNPETVSTDFDTSDRLYFEPLDDESVLDVLDNEGNPATMVQFGGQTAIKLSQTLGELGLPISGSDSDSIDLASDRGRFERLLENHKIPLPPGEAVRTLEEACATVAKISFPVVVRPSYVLGGRAMEVVQNATELEKYFKLAHKAAPNQTILIDRYLLGIELEVDAVCDGEDVVIPGIMQHFERAGVHSGDSSCVYPAQGLSVAETEVVVERTRRIGRVLGIKGLMNIQYVIPTGSKYLPSLVGDAKHTNREIYVLEVNPRASRTVPFISKVSDVPLVALAVAVSQGKTLRELGWNNGLVANRDLVAVKVPVFSTAKLTGVDTYLGPEMKSTGEVMGIDRTIGGALLKGIVAAGLEIERDTAVLLSIANRDKPDAEELIKRLANANCKMFATQGTAELIRSLGYLVTVVEKRLKTSVYDVLNVIRDGTAKAVVNTVTGDRSILQDGFQIRRTAVEHQIPCFTSLDTALIATELLAGSHDYSVRTVEEYVRSDGVRRESPQRVAKPAEPSLS